MQQKGQIEAKRAQIEAAKLQEDARQFERQLAFDYQKLEIETGQEIRRQDMDYQKTGDQLEVQREGLLSKRNGEDMEERARGSNGITVQYAAGEEMEGQMAQVVTGLAEALNGLSNAANTMAQAASLMAMPKQAVKRKDGSWEVGPAIQ